MLPTEQPIPFSLDAAVQPLKRRYKGKAGEWIQVRERFRCDPNQRIVQAAVTGKIAATDADNAGTSVNVIVDALGGLSGVVLAVLDDPGVYEVRALIPPADTTKIFTNGGQYVVGVRVWGEEITDGPGEPPAYFRTMIEGSIAVERPVTTGAALLHSPVASVAVTPAGPIAVTVGLSGQRLTAALSDADGNPLAGSGADARVTAWNKVAGAAAITLVPVAGRPDQIDVQGAGVGGAFQVQAVSEGVASNIVAGNASAAPQSMFGKFNASPNMISPDEFGTSSWEQGSTELWLQNVAGVATTTVTPVWFGHWHQGYSGGDQACPNPQLVRASYQRTAMNGSGVLVATGPKVRVLFGSGSGVVDGTIIGGQFLTPLAPIPMALAPGEWWVLHNFQKVNPGEKMTAVRMPSNSGKDKSGFTFAGAPFSNDTADYTADGSGSLPLGNVTQDSGHMIPGPSLIMAQYADGGVRGKMVLCDSEVRGLPATQAWPYKAFPNDPWMVYGSSGDKRELAFDKFMQLGTVVGLRVPHIVDALGANSPGLQVAAYGDTMVAGLAGFAVEARAAFGGAGVVTRYGAISLLPRSDGDFTALASQTPQAIFTNYLGTEYRAWERYNQLIEAGPLPAAVDVLIPLKATFGGTYGGSPVEMLWKPLPGGGAATLDGSHLTDASSTIAAAVVNAAGF
jgi:hypothetical protein